MVTKYLRERREEEEGDKRVKKKTFQGEGFPSGTRGHSCQRWLKGFEGINRQKYYQICKKQNSQSGKGVRKQREDKKLTESLTTRQIKVVLAKLKGKLRDHMTYRAAAIRLCMTLHRWFWGKTTWEEREKDTDFLYEATAQGKWLSLIPRELP